VRYRDCARFTLCAIGTWAIGLVRYRELCQFFVCYRVGALSHRALTEPAPCMHPMASHNTATSHGRSSTRTSDSRSPIPPHRRRLRQPDSRPLEQGARTTFAQSIHCYICLFSLQGRASGSGVRLLLRSVPGSLPTLHVTPRPL